MAANHTIKVPHLGGILAGYRLSNDGIDPKKPTLVLINSMCTTSSLYDAQFASKALHNTVNLLAIEPLGHGATSCPSDHFTYWDTAIMALQVMDALNVPKAFALGTSQGGWMVVRMALLAPDRVSVAFHTSHSPPAYRGERADRILSTVDTGSPPSRYHNGFRVSGL